MESIKPGRSDSAAGSVETLSTLKRALDQAERIYKAKMDPQSLAAFNAAKKQLEASQNCNSGMPVALKADLERVAKERNQGTAISIQHTMEHEEQDVPSDRVVSRRR